MIVYFKSLYGQSFEDLCLQAYGSLDLFIKFCIDNLVEDTSIVTSPLNLFYDSNLIQDVKKRKKYKTATVNNSSDRWHDDYFDDWHD